MKKFLVLEKEQQVVNLETISRIQVSAKTLTVHFIGDQSVTLRLGIEDGTLLLQTLAEANGDAGQRTKDGFDLMLTTLQGSK